ncbi:MAG: VTT domain-containing protein [Candidatus Lokiarchaeota archaeon]|nr:VTT domain-containing protein [Candidatus Lokiarchaeota archaeon]
MAVSKNLTIVFIIIYLIVIVYIFLFLYIPDFQNLIITSRQNLIVITQGSNYFWALLISFGICFLGSASIGFPVPFPFVLFSLSNSVYLKYSNMGLEIAQILQTGPFWIEILALALIGGLGSALGESTGYAAGYGAKKLTDERNSELLSNINGFGKLILKNQKRTPLYIFLFALTPLPDDILFLPLGMIKYPFWKCIIPGWLGKNFTTLVYCCWPIFVAIGFMAQGIQSNDKSSIITEAILLLVTITVMFFIMAFNWTKFLEKRSQKKLNKKSDL